jgi:formylglycine-generating enzyme required for sulfatase activity
MKLALISALILTALQPAAAAQTSYQDCADCPEMVVIPAGRFVMGAAAGEEAREGLAEGFPRPQPAAARGGDQTFFGRKI